MGVVDLIRKFFVYLLMVIVLAFDILWFPLVYYLNSPAKLAASLKRTRITKHVHSSHLTWKSLELPGKLHLQMIDENIKTMAEVLRACTLKYKGKKCLGTRRIIDETEEVQENGKTFTKYTMGFYEWKTYIEVDTFARSFGKGIREIGNCPHHNIAIFAETRAEWMIAAHGLFKQSMPIVTIYATLGEEGIVHAVNETEVTILITSYELVHKLRNILAKMPLVDTIIYMEDQLKSMSPKVLGCKGLRLIKFTDVIRLGELSNVGVSLPNPEDVAIIMYTSGSTGTPKGVLLKHENLLATMKAFSDITESMGTGPDEVMLGFLPLAHIFELLVENVCLCSGVLIGYSNANTLLDTSTKIRTGSKGDASVLQPTVMTVVPLVLDRVVKGIRDKVEKSNIFKRILFDFGYKYKLFWSERGYNTPFTNYIVFRKVMNVLGGHVRFILCGGAPLSVATHEFVQICLDVKVIIGYGLTETTSCATVMRGHDRSRDTVGQPVANCYIRLIDWKEGGYSIRDKPNPRGEVVIGGPVVSSGYYKLPEKTGDDFFNETISNVHIRWFKTGDIGVVREDGSLLIIDRRKDLIKLQNGEYISLGKIETALKTCPLIDNACIVAWSNKEYCIALVSPNQPNLEALAKKLMIRNTNFQDLCAIPDLTQAVFKVIVDHCRLCKFERNEMPARIKLCCQTWTPDIGLVTPTFKLRRKEIERYYKADIEKLFK